MEKIKEYKFIIIIGLVFLGLLFYWFQIRPINIKKNCSQIREVIPADIGITKNQADINTKIYNEKCGIGGEYQGNGRLQSFKCYLLEKDTRERVPASEKTAIRETTKNEYDLCLRNNGL